MKTITEMGAIGFDSYGRMSISAVLRDGQTGESMERTLRMSEDAGQNIMCSGCQPQYRCPENVAKLLRLPGAEADSGSGCVCVQYSCDKGSDHNN